MSNQQDLIDRKIAMFNSLVSKASEEAAVVAVQECINIGKSEATIKIKLAQMGGDMSYKTKWATSAAKKDGDELPEETVSDQPELGI